MKIYDRETKKKKKIEIESGTRKAKTRTPCFLLRSNDPIMDEPRKREKEKKSIRIVDFGSPTDLQAIP